MPKTPGPKFTQEQRKRIELLTVDCITFDLNENESIRYFAMRAPDLAALTVETFRRYKKKVQADPYYSHWINEMVKAGYVRMYKDLIDEMLALSKRNKRRLLEEESLPRTKAEAKKWEKDHPNALPPPLQSPGLIIAYMNTQIAINKRLSQLINSGPVAAKIHAILRLVDPETPDDEKKRILQTLEMAHA